MKQAVRVFKTNGGSYNHYYIQILEKSKDNDYAYVIGTIHWQSNQDTPDDWYGRAFQVDIDRVDRLTQFTKIANKVKDCYSPSEVLHGLNAEAWQTHEGTWFREADRGKNVYRVLRLNTLTEQQEFWSTIIAPDYVSAVKEMARRYKTKTDGFDRWSIDHIPMTSIPTIQ